MMTKILSKDEKLMWFKYRKPAGSNIHRLKVNQVNLSTANSIPHELAKTKIALELMKDGHKIITEAEEIATGLRRDLVYLTFQEIYEFDESSTKRGKRHPKGINVYWYDLQRFRTKEEVE